MSWADTPPPAPTGLTASATGSTAVSLTWAAVTGVDRYRVDRKAASTSTWATVDQNVTTTPYAVSGLACGTAYGFRVGSHGDGKTHKGWSLSYATTTATTAACKKPNNAPSFAKSSYSFTVPENTASNTVVGTVSATDPDSGDTLTYSITGGNSAGKFALGSGTTSTSVIVAGTLDYETTKSYTLTVQVGDGKGGTATTTVSIAVSDVVDTVPPAPSGLKATPSAMAVLLTWTAPNDATITGYRIYRETNVISIWSSSTSTPSSDPKPSSISVIDTGSTNTSYVDKTVSVGTSYSYAVMAINGVGVGPRTHFVTVEMPSR